MSLFPSTIIITSSLISAQKKVDLLLEELHHQMVNDPDLFILDDYTIASVRLIKKFLSQKPFNHDTKIILIPQAEHLNLESQNALLKNLEEPGQNNYFILTTTAPSLLLPTLLSRCQKIKLAAKTVISDTKLWPITGNTKKDLEFAATLTFDKNQIQPLLQNQLLAYQQLLVSHPSSELLAIIKKLIKSIEMIDAHVDPKSALDYFFLK